MGEAVRVRLVVFIPMVLCALLLTAGCKPNPTASFVAEPNYGIAPLSVQFTDKSVAASRRRIVKWKWEFGDGNSSTAQNPEHTYISPGLFFPSLTVTDNFRKTHYTFQSLRVDPKQSAHLPLTIGSKWVYAYTQSERSGLNRPLVVAQRGEYTIEVVSQDMGQFTLKIIGKRADGTAIEEFTRKVSSRLDTITRYGGYNNSSEELRVYKEGQTACDMFLFFTYRTGNYNNVTAEKPKVMGRQNLTLPAGAFETVYTQSRVSTWASSFGKDEYRQEYWAKDVGLVKIWQRNIAATYVSYAEIIWDWQLKQYTPGTKCFVASEPASQEPTNYLQSILGLLQEILLLSPRATF